MFSNYFEYTSAIIKSLEFWNCKILSTIDIIDIRYYYRYYLLQILPTIIYYIIYHIYLRLIYIYFNDKLLLQAKNNFIQDKSVNPYNTRVCNLLFIHHINKIHFGTKSIWYNGLSTWSNFSRCTKNKKFDNVGIFELKKKYGRFTISKSLSNILV